MLKIIWCLLIIFVICVVVFSPYIIAFLFNPKDTNNEPSDN